MSSGGRKRKAEEDNEPTDADSNINTKRKAEEILLVNDESKLRNDTGNFGSSSLGDHKSELSLEKS